MTQPPHAMYANPLFSSQLFTENCDYKMQRCRRSQLFFYSLIVLVLIKGTMINGADFFYNSMVTEFPTGKAVSGTDEFLVQLRMQGAIPSENDQILCSGFTLKSGDQFWIKEFHGIASSANVRHMGLSGCNHQPNLPCGCTLPDRSPIVSWVRNTPPIRFDSKTSTTGFSIGGDSQIKYVFLEIRYHGPLSDIDYTNGFDVHITRTKPMYEAAIYPIMGKGTIPPNTSQHKLDACITIPSTQAKPIKAIAYQPHTEDYGKLVSAYVKNKKTGTITEIGRGNPRFPQAYYATSKSITLNPGDTIMLRCIYDTTGVTAPINTIGLPSSTNPYKEMCIMNILWIMENVEPVASTNAYLRGSCTEEQSSSIPAESTQLLKDNPILNLHALYGNQTGTIAIDSSLSVNLGLENFKESLP